MVDRSKAIQELINIVGSSVHTPGVKAAAVEGLGYAGGPEARACLLKVVNGTLYTPAMKEAAARALGRASAAD